MKALKFAADNGVVDKEAYPYVNTCGACRLNETDIKGKLKYNVQSYQTLSSPSVDKIKQVGMFCRFCMAERAALAPKRCRFRCPWGRLACPAACPCPWDDDGSSRSAALCGEARACKLRLPSRLLPLAPSLSAWNWPSLSCTMGTAPWMPPALAPD